MHIGQDFSPSALLISWTSYFLVEGTACSGNVSSLPSPTVLDADSTIYALLKIKNIFTHWQMSPRGQNSSPYIWMWELDYKESWAQKNWCFWTVVLEKTLESPLDCKEIRPVLKEISPGGSLEGLMLKLKLQYFGHLMWRADSFERPWCWERLRAGGEGDDRGWDGWMASPTRWTWVWVNSGSWWWTGRPSVLWFMGWQKVRHDWMTELN